LHKVNYCNGFGDFINYALSNPRNISGGNIRCPYKRCKNKKFVDADIVMTYLLQKGFMEKYFYWFAHREPHVPYETMVEMMVESISSSSNVYGVVNDNSNPYRNMVMDVIRIN